MQGLSYWSYCKNDDSRPSPLKVILSSEQDLELLLRIIASFAPNVFFTEITPYQSAEPITALYHKSLQAGEVPQNWCKAIICPIFKNGDPDDVANYRPVSVKYPTNCSKKLCFCFL